MPLRLGTTLDALQSKRPKYPEVDADALKPAAT
jgi:hypothetical protein